jgi:hypothetical protein
MKNLTGPLEKEVSLGPAHGARESAQIIEIVKNTLNNPSESRYHKDARKAVNELLRKDGMPLMREYFAIAYEICKETDAIALQGGFKRARSLADKISRVEVADLMDLYELTGKQDYNMDVSFHVRDTCRLRLIHPTEVHRDAAANMMFKRLGVNEERIKNYNGKPITGYKAVHGETPDGVELQFRTLYAHMKAENDSYSEIKRIFQGNKHGLIQAK